MNNIFSQRGGRIPMIDVGENPLKIPDEDPLLHQLFNVHPDRRYESLHFEKKSVAR